MIIFEISPIPGNPCPTLMSRWFESQLCWPLFWVVRWFGSVRNKFKPGRNSEFILEICEFRPELADQARLRFHHFRFLVGVTATLINQQLATKHWSFNRQQLQNVNLLPKFLHCLVGIFAILNIFYRKFDIACFFILKIPARNDPRAREIPRFSHGTGFRRRRHHDRAGPIGKEADLFRKCLTSFQGSPESPQAITDLWHFIFLSHPANNTYIDHMVVGHCEWINPGMLEKMKPFRMWSLFSPHKRRARRRLTRRVATFEEAQQDSENSWERLVFKQYSQEIDLQKVVAIKPSSDAFLEKWRHGQTLFDIRREYEEIAKRRAEGLEDNVLENRDSSPLGSGLSELGEISDVSSNVATPIPDLVGFGRFYEKNFYNLRKVLETSG